MENIMPQYDIMNSQTRTPPMGRAKSSLSGQRSAKEILLLCTTANISHGKKERISQILAGSVDWRYLLYLAEFHGVAPLIAHNLVANGLASQVPQPCLERLNKIYHSTLYRNVILSGELSKVLSLFSQHDIAAIVLKGTILAEQLYGNPGLRTVSDMDILVQPQQVSLASSLILEMGYKRVAQQVTRNHPFHEEYYKQVQYPVFIELHWNLDDPKLVAVPQQEIWHRAQLLQIQGGTTMVLSPEDNLLFLSNHLSKHSTNLLRSLNDIAELLKKYHGLLDWDYVLESTHSWGIEAAVYYSLWRAQEIFGAPVPTSVVKVLKPESWRRWLLDFLISQEFFISNTRSPQLRNETCVVVRSLMMRHVHQAALVLARNRGRNKRAAWLRTATWIVLVFGAALGRNAARFVSGWRS